MHQEHRSGVNAKYTANGRISIKLQILFQMMHSFLCWQLAREFSFEARTEQ
jgi:hypothetical protein